MLDRLRAEGVAPELVYEVELDGYELAEQSVGVMGDDGFGAVYVSPDGPQVTLRVEWGTFSDDVCPETPLAGTETPTSPVACERDDAGWYRVAGDAHEYVVARGGRVLRLAGPRSAIGRAELESASVDARHVGGAGDGGNGDGTTGPPPTPIERGDLPATGDGAPDNDVGPGG